MAPRSLHSTLWCVLGALLLATECCSASISLTPHTSYRRKYTWPQARKFIREMQQKLGDDLMHQVEEATRAEYLEVPHPIAQASQILLEGINCSNIHSNLHKNNLGDDVQFRPSWIHSSKTIGDCPTRYVTRNLPTGYFPPVILEAHCACRDAQCSEKGHQCVPISRHVPVWVRQEPKLHVLDVMEVNVACICARRRSYRANNLLTAAVQN